MKLEIRDLEVSFAGRPVASVGELAVDAGEIVGLAGESGSGKSMTILAVLGLAGTAGATVTGSVRLDGQELTQLSGAGLRAVRGRRIAAIFQSPALAFNPVYRVGRDRDRTLRLHGLSAAEANERADGGHAQRPARPRTCCAATPPSCPAGSCSGWRSRSRWRCGPRCCSPTSRPARST